MSCYLLDRCGSYPIFKIESDRSRSGVLAAGVGKVVKQLKRLVEESEDVDEANAHSHGGDGGTSTDNISGGVHLECLALRLGGVAKHTALGGEVNGTVTEARDARVRGLVGRAGFVASLLFDLVTWTIALVFVLLPGEETMHLETLSD